MTQQQHPQQEYIITEDEPQQEPMYLISESELKRLHSMMDYAADNYLSPSGGYEIENSCRSRSYHSQKKSTVVEDITFEGAAIVQTARREGYEQGMAEAREKVLELVWIEVQSCGVSRAVFDGIAANIRAKSLRSSTGGEP
jgi:hypothetical protein